ncbi:MAG: hypothetical protein ACOYXC_16105 [Candidatus Rifleibacteriota bacterium]
MSESQERKLTGIIAPAATISETQRREMFALMHQFYLADETAFYHDLQNKHKIILLHDQEQKLQGFTSARLFDLEIKNGSIKILFSGDTIIHPDFWGTLELPRIWGRLMLDTINEIHGIPLFWFLISSGYRTYRFLPAYFHEFFPRHDAQTPAEMQNILDAAATFLFGSRYEPSSGIIKLEHPTPLREVIAPPGEERRKNPHIDFFLNRNPGYVNGEELACITQLGVDNIKPFVKRLLRT